MAKNNNDIEKFDYLKEFTSEFYTDVELEVLYVINKKRREN